MVRLCGGAGAGRRELVPVLRVTSTKQPLDHEIHRECSVMTSLGVCSASNSAIRSKERAGIAGFMRLSLPHAGLHSMQDYTMLFNPLSECFSL